MCLSAKPTARVQRVGHLLFCLYRSGFDLLEPFYLQVDHIRLKAGYIYFNNRTFFLDRHGVTSIERWLEIRKQRGKTNLFLITNRWGKPYLVPTRWVANWYLRTFSIEAIGRSTNCISVKDSLR